MGHANFPVKQIIHIELCETEFKRRKAELEKGKMFTYHNSKAASQLDKATRIQNTKQARSLMI